MIEAGSNSVLVLTFGPIESRSNGYFLRVSHLTSMLVRLGLRVHIIQFQIELSPTEKSLPYSVERHLIPRVMMGDKWTKITQRLTFDPLSISLTLALVLWTTMRSIRKILRADVVVVEGGLFLVPLLLSKLLRRVVVFDASDINTLVAERVESEEGSSAFLRKALWLFAEMMEFRLSDYSTLVSETDLELARHRFGAASERLLLIPNGVEPPSSPNATELAAFRAEYGISQHEELVVFVGDFRTVTNRLAAKYLIQVLSPELLPRPKTRIVLAGGGLAEDSVLPSNVRYLGQVEQLNCLLRLASICVAPLKVGSGTKLKILTYLQAGKPIVTTPIGMEGLDFAGPSVIVASLSDFHEKVLWALDHTHELLDQSRTMAREVELTSSWEFIESRFARPAFESIVTRL